MDTILSLLLVLLQTLKNYLNVNPKCRTLLPCPDYNSQRFGLLYKKSSQYVDYSSMLCVVTIVASTGVLFGRTALSAALAITGMNGTL